MYIPVCYINSNNGYPQRIERGLFLLEFRRIRSQHNVHRYWLWKFYHILHTDTNVRFDPRIPERYNIPQACNKYRHSLFQVYNLDFEEISANY